MEYEGPGKRPDNAVSLTLRVRTAAIRDGTHGHPPEYVPVRGPPETAVPGPCAKRMSGPCETHPERCTEHLRSRQRPTYSSCREAFRRQRRVSQGNAAPAAGDGRRATMDEVVRQAMARAITTMRDHLGDRLTVDDLARAAMFSKFHFTRMFLRATGLSPGRFLSALRLAEAKRLLATTTISVADISHQVGYNSVGTFSARFSGSVGVSPSGYRQSRGLPPRISEHADQAPSGSTVRGHVHCPHGTSAGAVFVGLFPAKITEGRPVRYAILAGPGPYRLADVPPGSW